MRRARVISSGALRRGTSLISFRYVSRQRSWEIGVRLRREVRLFSAGPRLPLKRVSRRGGSKFAGRRAV